MEALGWAPGNMLATIGACIIALGGVVFLINVFISRKRGEIAGNDPWGGDTLEWAAASPPENYNFEYLPVASSRSPMWVPRAERIVATGLRNDRREVLVTTLMDGEPHHRLVLPSPSIWPFLAALAVSIGFAGSVFKATSGAGAVTEQRTLDVSRLPAYEYFEPIAFMVGADVHRRHRRHNALHSRRNVLLRPFAHGRLASARRSIPAFTDSVVWYFIVAIWMPIYMVIYWGPRIVGSP